MNEDQQVDIQYVDDDIIAAMDEEAYDDEDQNDFETFNEEEFGEGDQYEEGQIIQQTAAQNDSYAQFNNHKDSVYCIAGLSKTTGNIYVSGDGKDKAYVWTIAPEEESKIDEDQKSESQMSEMSTTKVKVRMLHELKGHTETVEYAKFSYDGRFLLTGGMNNFLRVWDVVADFTLKSTLDSIP